MVNDEHREILKGKEKDLEFARNSNREELEAINNYQARIEETHDSELKKILIHNMNEEKEHFAMLTEWMRKNDKEQDKVFREHD